MFYSGSIIADADCSMHYIPGNDKEGVLGRVGLEIEDNPNSYPLELL